MGHPATATAVCVCVTVANRSRHGRQSAGVADRSTRERCSRGNPPSTQVLSASFCRIGGRVFRGPSNTAAASHRACHGGSHASTGVVLAGVLCRGLGLWDFVGVCLAGDRPCGSVVRCLACQAGRGRGLAPPPAAIARSVRHPPCDCRAGVPASIGSDDLGPASAGDSGSRRQCGMVRGRSSAACCCTNWGISAAATA